MSCLMCPGIQTPSFGGNRKGRQTTILSMKWPWSTWLFRELQYLPNVCFLLLATSFQPKEALLKKKQQKCLYFLMVTWSRWSQLRKSINTWSLLFYLLSTLRLLYKPLDPTRIDPDFVISWPDPTRYPDFGTFYSPNFSKNPVTFLWQ